MLVAEGLLLKNMFEAGTWNMNESMGSQKRKVFSFILRVSLPGISILFLKGLAGARRFKLWIKMHLGLERNRKEQSTFKNILSVCLSLLRGMSSFLDLIRSVSESRITTVPVQWAQQKETLTGFQKGLV